ncbi:MULTISPECIES: autotransporter outer membrane beta-barrel domain-containing protein [Veillonella]|jgi:outer membrane autotransporter protein|uniref:Pertactin autotransporter n=1 Tax=Veillonella parvula TaxID=29466 RepID=A0A6N3C1C0_VEIPA|nr:MULTISPECIES: autotransporter outer membrane beta-barrel domain-containing protein [Veillonella]EFG24625.1 outer membrane autotransporter barrel domain protein [Veillonella sp. 6_1_27]MDU0988920.1 autotransporter domain-containing protein [Veillonella parvula]MDU1046262.1 autotransporter domain-containing protein [Veillonella parvula]MDU3383387.1 autotransporter domain-containing protein [Veillonella sp.]MDU3475946.1 autotransporter domain-containing protein [Veillonella sp.]
MKRMCKANLSLAIALTIASSVVPYVMAEYPVVSAVKGETLNLGKVQGTLFGIDADNKSTINADYVSGRLMDGRKTIITSQNGSTVNIKNGDLQVGRDSNPLVITKGGTVNLGVDGNKGNFTGHDMSIEGDVRIDGSNTHPSEINIGVDSDEVLWTGFALNLADKNAKQPNHINVFLGDRGYWDHMYQGGLNGTSYSTMTTPSRVHRLVGSKNRNFESIVTQSEHNEIHIDKLEGHVNFVYDPNGEYDDKEDPSYKERENIVNGLTPESFWGGDVHITSAAPNSGAHMYTSRKGLDLSTEDNVNKVLDNLAHKVYYHNYVNGERNLQGTVAIASEGAESARFKVLTEGYAKEGAVTWQADKNGQGKYEYGKVQPTPKPEVKPAPVPTPKPEVKPAPQPTPKPEVKPAPVPTPKPEVKPTPQPTPKPEVKPAPVPTPKPEVKPAPQPTPKPEVKPAPVPTPKPEVKPTPQPTPKTEEKQVPALEQNPQMNVNMGAFDTPHMRGTRSAIMSNINGWRTLTDNMYRSRVLQQGEPTGIWARVGGGKYNFNGSGIDTDTTYTRIQGGYDAKTGSGWTVGGQVSYLRGNDDYVFNGSGKEKAFAVGAYGLKNLGNNQYIHIESQVGRASNDFTVRNEIGEKFSGETKANAYTIGARYGKTVKLSNGTYIEPQAQLSYTHFGGDSFNAGSMKVDQSGVSSTVGGLGLEIGKHFGAGNLYTRLGVNHAFSGTVKTTYTSGATTKYTSEDIKGTWTDLAFGGRYGFNANNSIFADISTGLSGDYKAGWSVNAGFTHKF